jgi:cyclic pyranopterin phosphate synthase
VKINAVMVRGFNDDELEPMAAWARDLGVELRLIEFMPLDAPGEWRRDQVVPAGEILARLDQAFGLVAPTGPRGSAPAERYHYTDGRGTVGVIASVTRAFCAQCDRIRLTADGQVRTCLFANTEYDLREVLRGGDDEAVANVYLDAVARKQWGHRINEPDFVQPARGMSQIGG